MATVFGLGRGLYGRFGDECDDNSPQLGRWAAVKPKALSDRRALYMALSRPHCSSKWYLQTVSLSRTRRGPGPPERGIELLYL